MQVDMFLNKIEVQKALHAGRVVYSSFNSTVRVFLSNDIYQTVKPWLEELIEHYGVMCYNGQLDVIVAYALSLHTYRSLKWSKAYEYLKAERKSLYGEQNKKINSFVREGGNFMEVMVRGAGHMVPKDRPNAAKQIIEIFIRKFKN